VERNRKAGQNPPRVVAPTEEVEEYGRDRSYRLPLPRPTDHTL